MKYCKNYQKGQTQKGANAAATIVRIDLLEEVRLPQTFSVYKKLNKGKYVSIWKLDLRLFKIFILMKHIFYLRRLWCLQTQNSSVYFYKVLFPLPLKNFKHSTSSKFLPIYRGNKVLMSHCYTRYLMNGILSRSITVSYALRYLLTSIRVVSTGSQIS